MAKLEKSSIDDAAIRDFLQSNSELASALSDVADEVAAGANIRVNARAKYHGRGVGYKTRVRVVKGRAENNPLTSIVDAPAGAFLGTEKGIRHQVGAWGHKVDLWHKADNYDLAASADSLWVS
jgi:hypothetical protein